MPITLKQDLEAVRTKSDIVRICGDLGIETPAGIEFVSYALANALLFERKQKDYGPNNISKFGAFGCTVRMSDKFERIIHLQNNRRRKAVNESIADSYRDLSNYGIIAQMCEDMVWPSK